jgi:hypothetical protein
MSINSGIDKHKLRNINQNILEKSLLQIHWSHTYIIQYVQSVKNSQGYDPISYFLYRDDLLSCIRLKEVYASSESGR